MTTQPDRQNGDGLLKAARSRIAAMMLSPCAGLASSRAAAEEIERALDYLAAAQPTHDSAERAWQLVPKEPSSEMIVAAPGHSRIRETWRAMLAAAPAPQKPAPDAIREALLSKIKNSIRLLHDVPVIGMQIFSSDERAVIETALSAPMTPADPRDDPVEPVAQTPKEFVDTVLSACDPSNWDAKRHQGEVFSALKEAYEGIHEIAIEFQTAMYAWTKLSAPPVATVSEFTNEIGNSIRITIEGPTSKSTNDLTPLETTKLNEALTRHFATPTAIGDREAIARDIVTEWLGMFDPPPQIDFQQSEMLQCAIASALAIPRTPLRVQPGAGEREAVIEECAKIAKFGAKDCDEGNTDWHKGFRYAANATALEIERAIRALSRQAPPSSSERIRTVPKSCPQCFDESDCSSIDVCRAVATTDASTKGDGK